MLALACVILATVPFLVWPDTAAVLLARQFGADRDIPRNVSIESITPEIWPSGEAVVLRFKVTGKNLEDLPGAVTLYADDSTIERFPIALDTKQGGEKSIVTAALPPASINCTYTAWLGDGRLRHPGRIHYEPRPVVVEQTAWLQFPEYCGVHQDGSRYEQLQGRGDVIGIAGSSARVVVKVQKLIKEGFLELIGSKKTDVVPDANVPARESVKRRIPLESAADGSWQALLELRG